MATEKAKEKSVTRGKNGGAHHRGYQSQGQQAEPRAVLVGRVDGIIELDSLI
jgi:hypothetical protein